jgi:hypothetical protein
MSDNTITIVSGLPRSGTSMMMKVLEAGGMPVLADHLRAADSDNPNGYYEFEPVKSTREDPVWLAQAQGRAVKMVYKLLYDLPPDRAYRVVFMQRALKEVVASQNAMLTRLGRAGSGGPECEHTLVGALAAEVAACKAWLRARPNFSVAYVNYNAMLAAPAEQVAALNAFFNGTLNEAAMLAAVDPNLYRQKG